MDHYPRRKEVKVSVTTADGELLDSFTVCHYRMECEAEDQESVGSHASNALLAGRIERYLTIENQKGVAMARYNPTFRPTAEFVAQHRDIAKAVSVSHAIVRGKAEPIVFGIRTRKDGKEVYYPLSRPCIAQRSDKLAMQDAEAIAMALDIPLANDFGSLTNQEVPGEKIAAEGRS